MKISGFRRTDHQQYLWDIPLRGHGHVRTVIGDFAEDLIALLIKGRRHKTDSTCDYCPDISLGDLYVECKSAGRNKEFFVYKGRFEKDQRFAEDHPLIYAVWHHNVDTKKAETVNQLKHLLLRQTRAIYLIPFSTVEKLITGKEPTPLNSKRYGPGLGKDNPNYGMGYRLRLAKIEQEQHEKIEWENHEPVSDS